MRLVFLNIFLFLFVSIVLGQQKEDLEKQKRENYKDIKFTNELLERTKAQKSASYNQVVLLNAKIKTRKNIIGNINSEIELIDDKILIHQDVIINLQYDLKKLKDDYAKMIYYSYLHKGSFNTIMFILAADDFNMGFRRLKYYQQYSQHRKRQAKLIQISKQKISDEIVMFEIIRAEKNDLLLDKKVENKELLTEKQDKNSRLRQLKSEEVDLKKKLKAQYKVAQNLQREIERIIEEEARLAAERAKSSSPEFFKLTPDELLIAENIVKNKTRLPWPTTRGIITSDFGEHPHPFIKGVKIRNDGVDITTNEGATVRAIYEGVVSRVFVIPGAHKTVIIRHGNYLTVYSNLKEVIVKQGDKISTKQTIGVVFTDDDNGNKTVLQFQIWKENQKLNPVEWLAKQKNG